MVFAHVRIPHRAGHAAVGDNAAHRQGVDAGMAQHPVELGVEERRIGHLADRDIHIRLDRIDMRMAPRALLKIASPQKGAKRQQMGRDHRVAFGIGPQRELAGHDQPARRFHSFCHISDALRQSGGDGVDSPSTGIGALRR